MEFNPSQTNIVKEILNSYVRKQEWLLSEEKQTEHLIANKGKDPIIYDIVTDSINHNIFVAENIKKVVLSLEKKEKDDIVKGSSSTFASLAGGFDHNLSNQELIGYLCVWNEACDTYKNTITERMHRVNTVLKEAEVKGIKRQTSEVNLKLSNLLQETVSVSDVVYSFIQQNDPKKTMKIK